MFLQINFERYGLAPTTARLFGVFRVVEAPTPTVWRFGSVYSFGSVGNLYQKMHFAGSNPATDPKRMKSCYTR